MGPAYQFLLELPITKIGGLSLGRWPDKILEQSFLRTMKLTPRIVGILLGVLWVFLTACGKHGSGGGVEDKVISVSGEDAEMNAAIAKGRETLPEFWKVFKDKPHGESDFALKVKISDSHGVEYFWVVDIERSGGKIRGTINNDPETVKSVKLGDKMEVPEADISDWIYMRDGKMVGNYTVRPLLKRMAPEEAAAIKKTLAEP
jgi:uncharacterized protein YegJ (DUF2314 family)